MSHSGKICNPCPPKAEVRGSNPFGRAIGLMSSPDTWVSPAAEPLDCSSRALIAQQCCGAEVVEHERLQPLDRQLRMLNVIDEFTRECLAISIAVFPMDAAPEAPV
jgi:hypothetical protein